MTDERDRIVSYLRSQAAKLTVPELVEKVRSDAVVFKEALLRFPLDRFGLRPSAGEWSPNEVAAHIVITSDSFGRAIEDIVVGREPAATPIDSMNDDAPEKTGEQWWAEHQANRDRTFAAALAADPQANLDQTVYHPIFGHLNWRETLLFLRVHDLDHARQIQDAL